MAGGTGSSPGVRPGRRRVRTGRRVERRRVGGRAPAPGAAKKTRARDAAREAWNGPGRAAFARGQIGTVRPVPCDQPSGGHYHFDIIMESGELLAGRRSEFMSTRRSSHRVASRTLDLERRLRVLSAAGALDVKLTPGHVSALDKASTPTPRSRPTCSPRSRRSPTAARRSTASLRGPGRRRPRTTANGSDFSSGAPGHAPRRRHGRGASRGRGAARLASHSEKIERKMPRPAPSGS